MANRTIAIIPARGGSKRIEGENLRKVGGKPLIAHAIHHAKASSAVDYSLVSTDDEAIAEVAESYGGNVPFERPAKLATDTAPQSGALTHALDWATEHEGEFEYVCSLQATSPLRNPQDVNGAIDRLEEANADSCVSTSEFIAPPEWAVVDGDDGYLTEFFGENILWGNDPDRSQNLKRPRHPNGAVFAATVDAWRTHESFYTSRTVGYEMPPERSFDIDEPWELELVRRLINDQVSEDG